MQVHETPVFLTESLPNLAPAADAGKRLRNSLNSDFQNLLTLVCEAVPEFRTYDARKIAVSIGRSKNKSKFGVWAHVAPLRHHGGKPERKARFRGLPGRYLFDCEKIEKTYPQALYLMTFILPKFFRLSFEERLETLVHELYHLHPEFRGDLRRFPGPHVHHGPTPAAFKRRVHELAQKALRNFPEIKNHPLLHCGEETLQTRKYFRLDLPRKIFVRDELPLWDLMKKVLVAAVGMWAMVAMAQSNSVEVKITRRGYLLDRPELRAERMRSLQGYEVFNAKKLNYDRTWVYVEDNLGNGGWIPRTQVAVIRNNPDPLQDELKNNLRAEQRDPSGPQVEKEKIPRNSGGGIPTYNGDEEIDDPEVIDPQKPPSELGIGKAAFLNRDGRLYALPNPRSERLGVIERDDVLTILEHSPQGKWVRGRLRETGEEGWVPVRWLEEVRPDQTLGKFFEILQFHVEGTGGYGTKEHNLGGGMGFYFRGRRPISEGQWVRNIQVGLDSSYYLGAKTVLTTQAGDSRNYSVRFLVTNVVARFIFSPRITAFAFAPEVGLSYQRAFVETDLDTTELAAAKVAENPTYWGLVGGMRAFLSLSNAIYLHGAFRAFFMSDSFINVDAGMGLRF
jgi:predicted metallopeptidase